MKRALAAESDTRFYVADTLLRFVFARDGKGFDVTMPDGNVEHRARTSEPLPAGRVAVAVVPAELERLVGSYELGPGFAIAITRQGGQLFVQATGQPRFEMFATAPTEFFLKVVDARLSFHVDGSDRADSFVLHQGGRDLPGKRVP